MNARTVVLLVLLAAAVAVAGATLLRAGPTAGQTGLFKGLRQGQSIALKDAGPAFEIETYPSGISGTLRVSAIGPDYIAVRDTKRNITRIPIHAVKSVTIRSSGF